MNGLKQCLAGALVVALCLTPASAHVHPGEEAIPPTVSAWAQKEVNEAQTLGLIPTGEYGWPTDYRSPITRTQFRRMAMQFAAVQSNCDYESLNNLVAYYMGEKDADGQLISPFSDGCPGDAEAYYLGVVSGRGDSSFDPDGLITRQEAAAMLVRTYTAVGSAKPTSQGSEIAFCDVDLVSDWAKESVRDVTAWSVMKGLEDGSFAPLGQYSVEQCILTFLRLYERDANAKPVPLFSYEQCLGMAEDWTKHAKEQGYGLFETVRTEGVKATFLRLDQGGMMMAHAAMYFVYRKGGMKEVDLGICNYTAGGGMLSRTTETTQCAFSEDGETFHCVVPLSTDTISENKIVHKAGDYSISVNVDTLQYTLDYRAL